MFFTPKFSELGHLKNVLDELKTVNTKLNDLQAQYSELKELVLNSNCNAELQDIKTILTTEKRPIGDDPFKNKIYNKKSKV